MTRWFDDAAATAAQWLIDKSCPPIQYRLFTDVLNRPADDWDVQRSKERVYAYEPAVAISRAQLPGGTWLNKILDFEAPNASRKRGPGMVNQVLALLEYGWELSHPILHCSKELLFEYLDPTASVELYELNAYLVNKVDAGRSLRETLSRISAALLARGGARDPRLTAWASWFLDRLDEQYKNPEDPAVYDGVVDIEGEGPYRRLRKDAVPIDMFSLYLFAFLPELRATARARAVVERAVRHLFVSRGEPRLLLEVDGKRLMRFRLPRIFDLAEAEFADKKLSFLLHDLELLARVGVLTEYEKPRRLLSWVLALRNPDGVLRLGSQIEKALTPSQYHYFPLEDSWRGKHRKHTDVTFRALLIMAFLDRGGSGTAP